MRPMNIIFCWSIQKRNLSFSYAPLPQSNNYNAYVCEITALLDETFKATPMACRTDFAC